MLASAWRALGRYHALVAITTLPHPELHAKHHTTLEPLIERGQRDGSFRADVLAAWHLAMEMVLIHAAGAGLQAGRVPEKDVEAALLATVLRDAEVLVQLAQMAAAQRSEHGANACRVG